MNIEKSVSVHKFFTFFIGIDKTVQFNDFLTLKKFVDK